MTRKARYVMRKLGILAWVVVVVAAAPAFAQQQQQKKSLLLESYAEPRPLGMSRTVGYLGKELAANGVVSGDDLRTKIESTFSRPVHSGTAEELESLARRFAEGNTLFGSGSFTLAIAALAQASEGLADQSASVSFDPRLRETRRDALLALVKAYTRVNNLPAAKAALGELLRSFSEITTLSAAQYPPKMVALATEMSTERQAQSGSLTIQTVPSRRKIFVNEQAVGESPKTLTGLLPGKYRVFVPSEKGERKNGGLRIVEVKAKDTLTVQIQSEIDDYLETESYIGLRFASRADKERKEVAVACAVAEALGLGEVILLTTQKSPAGEVELVGSIYDPATRRRTWGVILPLNPQSNEQALSRFATSLKTRKEVLGVKIATEPAAATLPGPDAAADKPSREEDPRPSAATESPPEKREGRVLETKLGFTPQYVKARRDLWIGAGVLTAVGIPLAAAGVATHFSYRCNDYDQYISGSCAALSKGRVVSTSLLVTSGVAAVGVTLLIVGGIMDAVDRRDLRKARRFDAR